MNIFWLSHNLEQCAHYHIDIHVNKMLVEYAQILSTVHNEHQGYYAGDVYKSTHVHHPCVIWAATCQENYNTLFELWVNLAHERNFRWPTKPAHKSYADLRQKLAHTPNLPRTGKGITPPPLCMPEVYHWSEDHVISYQTYYLNEKRTNKNGKDMFKWTRRSPPDFVKNPMRRLVATNPVIGVDFGSSDPMVAIKVTPVMSPNMGPR